ncbi:MAG: hypothetical protein JWS12_373 [Candidatus Saccharibacteria bacterium]|nr:hypothetical protein [Candidatus Saccharibacteria bacterium]
MAKTKKLLNYAALGAGFVILVVAVAFGVHAVAHKQLTSDTVARGSCNNQTGATYTATVKNDVVTPNHIDAKQCDTLIIVNQDSTVRAMAFGLHENHTPYDGVTEKILRQNQSLSVTLVQTGNFRFHDHEHDEVQGTFSVTKR